MIALKNVSFQYQNMRESQNSFEADGIREINLQIKKGEFLIIAGRSGCGKTTLLKCINGLVSHFDEGMFEGTVNLNGQNTAELKVGQIGELAASVFQDPRSQFFTTNVFDELSFGCRNMGLSRGEILSRIDEVMPLLGIEALRGKSLLMMSSGEKQRVAIASCYCMHPLIFLFDEPSANLDEQGVCELFDMLKRLKKLGHTIIVLEHRLYYLRELMDRLAVMEQGRIQRIYLKEEALELSEKDIKAMGLRTFHPERLALRVKQTQGEGSLQIKQLAYRYKNASENVFTDLSICADYGEIIAVTGHNGIGKTTFAKVLTGLLKEQSGSILWNGLKLTPKQRMKNIYYVMQDSDYQLFSESVETELLLGINQKEEKRADMEKLLQYFGLQNYRNKHPMTLSRGQKQRVTIAAALMSDAKILILDEPSSGLDGDNMRKLSGLLQKAASQGRILFIVSHDAEFIRICCSRIIELRENGIYEK